MLALAVTALLMYVGLGIQRSGFGVETGRKLALRVHGRGAADARRSGWPSTNSRASPAGAVGGRCC